MSSIPDWLSGGGSAPTLADLIGPQTDGTNLPSQTAIMAQPTDTAGGLPAQYGQSVLDLFKYGIGQYTATQQQQQLFDYKKFEATNGGLFQQGRSATLPATSAGGKMSGVLLLGIGALVVFALLTHKG